MTDTSVESGNAEEHFPNVTAVVLNYNGFDDTVDCVRSLQNAIYPNLSLVLVDNASPDGSGSDLERTFPTIPLLHQASNTGYAGGNNAGIRFALTHGAEYVLVINNDVIVDPHFLEPMMSVAERLPSVGITTCLVYYQGTEKSVFSAAGKFSYLLCTGINKGSYIGALRNTTKECLTNFACGVIMLVSRKVFETVGFFDETYFMYFEDVEFSRRVLERYNIAFTPFGIAYHRSGGGRGIRSYTELYLYYHTRNRIWTFRRDSRLYRTYVLSFTILNTLVKSIIVSTNIVWGRERVSRQLRALWGGLRDGIVGKSNCAASFRIAGE